MHNNKTTILEGILGARASWLSGFSCNISRRQLTMYTCFLHVASRDRFLCAETCELWILEEDEEARDVYHPQLTFMISHVSRLPRRVGDTDSICKRDEANSINDLLGQA